MLNIKKSFSLIFVFMFLLGLKSQASDFNYQSCPGLSVKAGVLKIKISKAITGVSEYSGLVSTTGETSLMQKAKIKYLQDLTYNNLFESEVNKTNSCEKASEFIQGLSNSIGRNISSTSINYNY